MDEYEEIKVYYKKKLEELKRKHDEFVKDYEKIMKG
jgi:hypothetical protein